MHAFSGERLALRENGAAAQEAFQQQVPRMLIRNKCLSAGLWSLCSYFVAVIAARRRLRHAWLYKTSAACLLAATGSTGSCLA